MNWTRVKTAFIILLLVCNIVLIFVHFEPNINSRVFSEDKMLKDIKNKLNESGIDISDLNFPEINKVQILKVSEENVDFELKKEKFIKSGFESYSQEKLSGYLYTHNMDGSISIKYYGDLDYEYTKDYKKAFEIAQKCINLSEENIAFEYEKYIENKDGSFEFLFEQSYNNIRVLDGYTKIIVKGDKVLNFTQKIVNVKEYGQSQKIIPYSLALYRLYSMISEDKIPIKINKMNIVQELKHEDSNDIVSGETFVYYRFVSDKNESLNVSNNVVKGKIEGNILTIKMDGETLVFHRK